MEVGIRTEFSKPSQVMVGVPLELDRLWKESKRLNKQQEEAFGGVRHMSIHGLFYDMLLQRIAHKMKEESALIGVIMSLGGGLLGAGIDTVILWLIDRLKDGADFLGDLGQAMNDVETSIRKFHEKLGSYEAYGPENQYIYNPLLTGWQNNPYYLGEDGKLNPEAVHARQEDVLHTLTVTIDEQGNKVEEYAMRIMNADSNLLSSVDVGTSEHARQIAAAAHDPELEGLTTTMEEIGQMMARVDWAKALADFWFNAYTSSPNFQEWLADKQAEIAGG